MFYNGLVVDAVPSIFLYSLGEMFDAVISQKSDFLCCAFPPFSAIDYATIRTSLYGSETQMGYRTRTLSLDVTEQEYDFIYSQAKKENMTVGEYITVCTLAHDRYLYLSALISQLRRLKYQLGTQTQIDLGKSQEELLEMQRNVYNRLIDALKDIQTQ